MAHEIGFLKVVCNEASKTADAITRKRIISVTHIIDISESDKGGIDITMDDGRIFHSAIKFANVESELKTILDRGE